MTIQSYISPTFFDAKIQALNTALAGLSIVDIYPLCQVGISEGETFPECYRNDGLRVSERIYPEGTCLSFFLLNGEITTQEDDYDFNVPLSLFVWADLSKISNTASQLIQEVAKRLKSNSCNDLTITTENVFSEFSDLEKQRFQNVMYPYFAFRVDFTCMLQICVNQRAGIDLPPVLQTMILISPDTIRLTYDEALNESIIPALGDYVFTWPGDDFVITVDTTKAGSATDTFVLPTTGAGYDCSVSWGDGTTTTHSGTPGNITHIYPAPGTYQIRISGTFPRIFFDGIGDRLKLTSIDNFGTGVWSSMEKSFNGAANMVGAYTDTPDLSLVTNMNYMFAGDTVFNHPVNFDTSVVTTMQSVFAGDSVFNQTIAFDTSLVTNMSYMFYKCYVFNQPITFDTSLVTTMYRMMYECLAFKQNLSAFKIRGTVDIRDMLFGCDINDTGTTTNYDNTLIAWASDPLTASGRTFHAGTSKYGAGAGKTARDYLTGTLGWIITDGGQL